MTVVAGALAQRPGRAGHAWVFVNWMWGLRAIGERPLFVDRIDGAIGDVAAGVAWVREVMRWAGFDDDWSVTVPGGTEGLPRSTVRERCRGATVINVMGYLDDPDLLAAADRRIFLDIDPGFGQAWRHAGLADVFAGHDAFVTVGLNVGRPGCGVPDLGLQWVPTVPPVSVEHWASDAPPGGVFTTVASWRGPFAPVEVDGALHGLRVHEARRYADLPRRTGHALEMALDIDPEDEADRLALIDGGWRLLPPAEVAGDLGSYRSFVHGSRGEFAVAKQAYVSMRTGWLSDRTACYLASGRPAIVSDTGIGDRLPLGDGLLTFSDPDAAADALDQVTGNLAHHCAAAEELARTHLDAATVVDSVIRRTG